MKVDRIEINFIKNNHAINTVEIDPEDINIINESLKIAYSGLSKKYVDCITGGFNSVAGSVLEYEEKVKDLIGKIHA